MHGHVFKPLLLSTFCYIQLTMIQVDTQSQLEVFWAAEPLPFSQEEKTEKTPLSIDWS